MPETFNPRDAGPAQGLTFSLVPAELTPWIRNGFNRRILAPMIRKSWHAVRVCKSNGEAPLLALRACAGPSIVVMNHHSWWDPMLGLWLAGRYLPGRPCYAPMEAAQLARFGILKKLGVFGIDPDDPASLAAMTRYLGRLWQQQPGAVLWITPQGQFADPRMPIRLRPGAAAVAASLASPPLIVSLSTEMVFWTEKKPELLMRAAIVDAPEKPSTPAWHRVLTRAMQTNADTLREAATTRDPARFLTIGGAGTASTNVFYDAWLRLTGRGNRITPTTRG